MAFLLLPLPLLGVAQGQVLVSGTGDSDERKFEKKKAVIFWLLTIIQAQVLPVLSSLLYLVSCYLLCTFKTSARNEWKWKGMLWISMC